MTFKIHQVYKQNVSKKSVDDSEQKEEQKMDQSNDPQNLSLSSTDSNGASKTPKSLQQLRNDVLNSRSSVKPGTKNGIRPTAFDGGLEADMY